MVRPAGFEPAASSFVVKRYWTQGFLFNSMVSADMPHFGPFAANWVGIWVGKTRARKTDLACAESTQQGWDDIGYCG